MENLAGYNPTNWTAGMAITANRMMNIEDNLDRAVDAINILNRDKAEKDAFDTLSGTVNGLSTAMDGKASTTVTDTLDQAIQGLQTIVGNTSLDSNKTAGQSIGETFITSDTLTGQLSEAIRKIANLISASTNGDDAYNALAQVGVVGSGNNLFNQIYAAIGYTGQDANRTLLYPKAGKDNNNQDIQITITDDINALDSLINDVREQILNATTRVNPLYTSLAKRFSEMESTISTAQSYIDSATDNTSYADLPTAINTFDSNFTNINAQLTAVNAQLTAAKASTAWGNKENLGTAKTFIDDSNAAGGPAYGIDLRMEALEDYILNGNTGLEKRIIDIFGQNINASNTVAQAVAAAITTAKDYADNEKVDKDDIVNDYNYVPDENAAISTRAHKVLSASRGKDLNDRLAAKETEITNAHSSDAKGTTTNNVLTPKVFASLDARFEETESDVKKIVDELAMYNQQGAITNTNTRIDTIEKNVLEIGKEIGMISDLNTVTTLSDNIDRNNTDIDKLKAQIAGARIQTGTDSSGNPTYQYADLDGRFDTVEDLLNNNTTGAIPRITTLESDMNTASTGVKARLDTLEGTSATGAIKYGDINNNLTTDASVEKKVLDARQGKILKTAIDTAQNEINAAHRTLLNNVQDTLDTRFDDIEARATTLEGQMSNPTVNPSTLGTKVTTLESSLSGYTGANAVSAKFDNVDGRIDTIRNTINMDAFSTDSGNRVGDRVVALETGKVAKADIYNDLNYVPEANSAVTTHKVLDAAQGKILNDAISAMDTAYKAADAALSGRITDAQNEIDAAHRTDDDTLDDRFDAIESAASQLRTDVNEIATELSMLDNDTIAGTQSRIDNIETAIDHVQGENDEVPNGLTQRITALETTVDTQETGLSDRMSDAERRLNALDDESNGAITGLDNRIDTINYTISHTATQEDDTTGLVQHISALETIVNNDTTGVAATATALGNLTDRVDTLATKDTIVVPYDGQHSNYTNDEPNSTAVPTPSTSPDYLIADDDNKYFYWRYFGAGENQGWQKISGAGGGGTGSSSGLFIASLSVFEGQDALVPDENIDYFVGNSNDGYTHYRYKVTNNVGTFIQILPTSLINDISVDTVSIDNAAEADKWPTTQTFSGGLEAYAIDDTAKENNLLADFVAVRNARIAVTYDANNKPESQKLQVLDTNGKLMEYEIVGGGGDSGTLYSALIESDTPVSRSIPTNNTDPVLISAKVLINQGNTLLSNATAEGVIQYRQRNTTTWNTGSKIEVSANVEDEKYIIPCNTIFNIDITKYLKKDVTMEFRIMLDVQPAGENSIFTTYSSTFRVTQVNISIAAENFDYASVKNSNFQFNYRCFGTGIIKTVHFLIDNEDVITPVTTDTHNIVLQQAIPIAGKENGMHTFQVYFETPTGLQSNKLNYYILYNTDTTRSAPLIGAAAEKTDIMDGDEIIINYSVNTIGSENTDSIEIELYTLDEHEEKQHRVVTSLTKVKNNTLASPPYRTFNYPRLKKAKPTDPDPDPITVYVKFTATHNNLSDSQIIEIQVHYLNTTYDLEPENNNLLFNYSAYGRSNNDTNKETYTYTYTKVNGDTVDFAGTFNNFNWATDGYVDGESLIIGGGATLDIDVPIFSSTFDNVNIEENENIDKITTNGRTIEIDYEVLSTTNLGATIIDCLTNEQFPRGFRVTPQNCYLLNSGSKIDIDSTGFIKNEESVAAAYLNPGTRTHLTFVIEPISTTLAVDGTYHQSTNIYINGEFANSCPYDITGNDFDNDATITIGSDTCLIKLYSIKLYNRGLTESQVLHNYTVAPVATRDKLTRLEDNDILNNQGKVDYEKARRKYTCLLLTGMGTVNGVAVPTMAPYKGYPSVVGRQKDNETVGKTESGLLFTKPNSENTNGYSVEFDLQDKLIDPNNLYGYASSNNVQGTSSQKFPVKNLKVYLAKGDDTTEMIFDTSQNISVKKVYKYSINNAAKAAYQNVHPSEESLPEYITKCGENIATSVKNLDEVPTQEEVIALIETYLNAEDTDVGAAYSTYSTGDELIIHPTIAYKKSKKVKYALRENGIGESTLCWKADYMSTDHANTFNANIANTLYSDDDRLSNRWTAQTQYTVYGIKCLLFQQNGEDGVPQFVGDGCLNNDKGNHVTFGLETDIDGVWKDKDDNTMCQKWDFRNNTGSLLFFKHDGLFEIIDGKPAIARELECIYPDEGDLADIGLTPNYNHFQILSSWLGNRANYWYESDSSKREDKKQIFISEFTNHFNLNHILIYYLFMEYTALCDNRVKNIHMRTDNAGLEVIKDRDGNILLNGNENPNSGPWTLTTNLETRVMQEPIMDENGDYQFDQNGNMELGNVSHVFVKDSVINNIDWQQGEGHSNFAIWAPVLYDLDSCFSADNVGYLKIRYDADWDYSLYNKLKFAGYDSILWLQVEDCFQEELKVMAKKLYNRVVGLNYSTFYRRQITDNLASLCPAITNQDMILKYDNPWTQGFLDYSKDPPVLSKDKYKYLQRGTRTGQKAIFMKQRSLFLASKYDGNEFIQDKITFRAGTQVNHENSILTLVANQKLYPGAQFGDVNDTTKITRRASKIYDSTQEDWIDIGPDEYVPEFTPCQIQHSGNMNNTDGIEIYGASVLNDIGDISRFHPWQVKVGNAVNLKKLILGSNAAGYSNTSTDDIDGLNACALLEEINVCNLKQLTSLQLSNNGFIKKVYTTGSGLSTVALPRGGVLDTIAYGENITDITIINQSRLTNFSYENSNSNNYANVTRLWVENTPNVPIQEIITARLTPIDSQDRGLRSGGLRIVGLDLDLGDNPRFLELLASNLVEGTYLSDSGAHPTGKQTPYISGTIKIASIRSSLYNKLKSLYKDLDIQARTTYNEVPVHYRNYDGNELCTLYAIPGDDRNDNYVLDPTVDIDAVTNKPYINVPEKPQDAYYTYEFGTYTTVSGVRTYDKFSGWVKSDNSKPVAGEHVMGEMTLTAVFPTKTDRYYTVRWFDKQVNGHEEDSMYVKAGTDLTSTSSPIEAGTLNRVSHVEGVTKVFKGWSRPLGKILSDTDVYALWEESNINGNTSYVNVNTLNAADIYALSLLSQAKKKELLENNLGNTITIPMGQQFNYPEGVNITNLLGLESSLVLDGTAQNPRIYVFDNIKPLLENSDWTLALDYKFLMKSLSSFDKAEYILASCYSNANNQIAGFKLSLVTNLTSDGAATHSIQVSWGTDTRTIDYAITTSNSNWSFQAYRNVIVLSHNSNQPNKLRITYSSYTSQHNNSNTAYVPGESLRASLTTTSLTYGDSFTSVDKPLIIGGNYNASNVLENTNARAPAQGVVYWGKFWDTDLGQNNCLSLAAWPHESIQFYLTGYNGASSRSTEQIYSGSMLSFAAAQGIGDRTYYVNTNNSSITDDIYGWHRTFARSICNNVFYKGLPEAYKGIIKQQSLFSVERYLVESSERTVTDLETNDYLFLAARKEIDNGTEQNNARYEVNSSWTNPWGWLSTKNVYTPHSSYEDRFELTKQANINLNRYRFSGKSFTKDTRVFLYTTRPSLLYDPKIIDNGVEISLVIHSGDVWINSNNNIAYIYCSQDEVDNGMTVDLVDSHIEDGSTVYDGGWKEASQWLTRTFDENSTGTPEWHLLYVDNNGQLMPAPASGNRNIYKILCPEFTV